MHEIKAYLKRLALKTIDDCSFVKQTQYRFASGNQTLLLPSGDEKYYSFWVRDCAMMAESGLIPNEDLKRYIEIIAGNGQNGDRTVYLENGLTVPPYAIADHINYNGKPVFFPGTYEDGNDQGNGAFGFFPPFCDNYYFIIMVGCYLQQSHDEEILSREYDGLSLLFRLEKSFEGYNIHENELCESKEDAYTVDWGFTDSIKKTGLLLMSSLLRYRASTVLASLFPEYAPKRAYYQAKATAIRNAVKEVFYDEKSGWLYSATGICRQHDVWATAYAVYLGVLEETKTYQALKDGYLQATAIKDGYVRPILTNEDFDETTSWQCTCLARNHYYQNGAYWATPTGWYAKALYVYDRTCAVGILQDFIRHTEKYISQGAPFEWINADTTDFSGLRYGTSGVLPYTAFKDE